MIKQRFFLVIFFLVLSLGAHSQAAYAAKNTAAINQMKRIATAFRNAQNTGTRSAFRNVIRKYADLPTIALYSLGRYKSKLKKSRRSKYFRGVQAFMGRYFSNESRRYKVASTKINSNVEMAGKDVLVRTKVTLTTGTTYNVTWQLAKRRSGYKITDVKILGFSMTYLQRGMFTSYVRKKDGSVEQLITALNRHY
jgi:phospholipid transport system substrate-binding protein